MQQLELDVAEDLMHWLQVDQHIDTLHIRYKTKGNGLIPGRLARKGLKPKQLLVNGIDTDQSLSAMRALFAKKQHHPMFQRVQQLTFRDRLPKDLPQVSVEPPLASAIVCHCQPALESQHACTAVVVSSDPLVLHNQTAAQGLFTCMPLLTHLTINQELTAETAQMLVAARLDTLRSLSVRTDLSHAWFLQGCTQLKALTLTTFHNLKGASAIAQLAGLTYLELNRGLRSQLFSAEEQSELCSALAALSNLQSLVIDHAPPGPVNQALSQLASLTQLVLAQQDLVPNPGPLALPSCVKLSLCNHISVQHIAGTHAPQLQHLDVSLVLKPSDRDAVRVLCKGVLRACSTLTIHMNKAWSQEDTAALMAVLSQYWQPSAEALVLSRSGCMGLERRSSSDTRRQWSLELRFTHCSRQCLELLPKGLGSLCLWWVLWLPAHHLCGLPVVGSAHQLFCLL
jgi:hypothetical protein